MMISDDNNDRGGLAAKGVAAIGGVVGGVFMLLMGALPLIFGIAIGGVAAIIGGGQVFSKDSADRKGGIVLFGAGALTLLSKLGVFAPVKALAGTLMGIGAIALLGYGVWNAIRFVTGLKDRS
jgi:hypothetical protein